MMKSLFLVLALLFSEAHAGDAVIFSGNDVKTLKYNIDLFGRSKILGLNTDPSAGAGVQAPLASLGLDYLTGYIWAKTGPAATDWEELVPGGGGGGSGTPLTFAGFDAGGFLSTIPAWEFDPITSGHYVRRGFDVSNPLSGTTQVYHEYTSYVSPTEDTPNLDLIQLRSELDYDDSNSGFSGNNLTLIQATGRHLGNGSLVNVSLQQNNFSFGNGTSTGSAQNIQAFSSGVQINAGYSANSLTGAAIYPSIDGSLNSFIGYGSYGNGTSTPGNYIGFDVGPSFLAPMNNMLGLNVYTNNDLVNFSGANASVGNSGLTIQNFSGFNVYTNTSGTNFNGVNINGQGTYNNVNGVNIDVTQFTTPYAVGLNNRGALQSSYEYTLPGSPGYYQVNYLGSGAIVQSGVPVQAFGFGLNAAALFTFQDDFTDTISGLNLGWTSVGFVGTLAGSPGKTASAVNGALAGFGVPPDSTGGTVTEVTLFRAAGLLGQGGTISIDSTYAFKTDLALCTFATNCFGLYLQDENQSNWVAGTMQIGGSSFTAPTQTLEIEGSTLLRDGHLLSTQTSLPSTAPQAAAGTGATCSVSGTDTSGKLTLVTGNAGWASGDQCIVTFNDAFPADADCVLSPANSSSALGAANIYFTSSAAEFRVSFVVADVAPTAYNWNYICVGR